MFFKQLDKSCMFNNWMLIPADSSIPWCSQSLYPPFLHAEKTLVILLTNSVTQIWLSVYVVGFDIKSTSVVS